MTIQNPRRIRIRRASRGLAGGGKGALIGGAAGAAAGTAGAALTGKKKVLVAAETPLTFRLGKSIELARRKSKI